jgi:hypothetical protein
VSPPLQRGDIGVQDGARGGGRNHHFLVIDPGNGVHYTSIEGNSMLQEGGVIAAGVIAR